MIAGVGTDMVEISRIRRACERRSFLERVYTEEERRQAGDNYSRLAGSFAVKEAVSKVFGTGFRSFFPCDIEVLRDEAGKPYVNLYGGAKERFDVMGMIRIEVSITNTKELAFAFAVGESVERA